ncbi:hypothetical protein, partial [Ralstonia solanacearum]|uniref:hypothetical protein n=1 Tax=Ralstonia solanacearum TaxID=305 RepID=UPI001E37DE42
GTMVARGMRKRRVFSIEGRAGARNQAVLRCASEKVRRSCQESLTAERTRACADSVTRLVSANHRMGYF